MSTLGGKVMLVTGAASGIGEACVERFLTDGATVIGADVQPPRRDLALPDGIASAAFAELDVRDETATSELVASIVAEYGRLDGVVTAAGVAGGGPAHMVDGAAWDHVLAVNLKGTFLTAKCAVAAMLHNEPVASEAGFGERGAVVTIASVEGLEGTAGGSAYNASKGGVVLFTKNLAIDYGRAGIRANCICPGFIQTPMLAGVLESETMSAVRDDIVHEHKLRRLGQPSEIAAAARFLLSSDASFVTGVALPVDGGYTAGRDHGVTDMFGF
ncbi:MAG TPA: SDR family NAD(P)-dependent oxidoreductase [Acidimicrobiia bacterium]|jgi:NAD(P)-dependent dehydrogenase (short-subunit alcohol dehydrogenase family)